MFTILTNFTQLASLILIEKISRITYDYDRINNNANNYNSNNNNNNTPNNSIATNNHS